MTLEAIANYGQELQKARRRIEEANRAGEAILTRLQNDLEAVRSFAEEESSYGDALRVMREQDSELYHAIRAAYLQEQDEANGDAVDQHCQGMISAIEAVYRLGYAAGFTAGSEEAERRILGE